MFFFAGDCVRKKAQKHTKERKIAHKRAKMHHFCRGACNTPIYYTPISPGVLWNRWVVPSRVLLTPAGRQCARSMTVVVRGSLFQLWHSSAAGTCSSLIFCHCFRWGLHMVGIWFRTRPGRGSDLRFLKTGEKRVLSGPK